MTWRGPGEDAGCIEKWEPECRFSVGCELLVECIEDSPIVKCGLIGGVGSSEPDAPPLPMPNHALTRSQPKLFKFFFGAQTKSHTGCDLPARSHP